MALRTRLHHRNPREHPCTLARHGPRKTSNRKGSSLARAVRGVLVRDRPARGVQSELARGGPSVLVRGGPSVLVRGGPSELARGGPSVLVRGGPSAAAGLGVGLLPG